MIKYLITFSVLVAVNSCKLNQTTPNNQTLENQIKLQNTNGPAYLNEIKVSELKKKLYYFASDEMEGRATGTEGQQKAASFLREEYKKLGILSPAGLDYYQKIPKDFFNNRSDADAVNVLGYIKGEEVPEELIVISAHYDHLGITKDGKINNGADDDGSGTIGILQIAKAFQKAVKEGNRPKRSILFLHVVGEEIGLYGSRYYVENPVFPIENTVVDLNIDMIGRVDDEHCDEKDYMYIIGSDKLSTELHLINEKVKEEFSDLVFDYKFNAKNDPNRFYFRSDHYNFAKNKVPVIFYFNGTHEDYHEITDTADKIDYPLLKKRCDHIFLTAWELANRDERIKLDKD